MNNLKFAIFVSLRGYHGRGRSGGPRGSRAKPMRRVLTEEQLYPDSLDHDEPDEDDFDDVEKDEADFTGANRTYREHMAEQKFAKEKLKMQITARKYFKSEDPNFITWTEKMQIKSLHERDPVEWSMERLSESFPALPDTIRKIIRAKWLPKNAQTVLKYDEKVIDNWNKFKSGNIAISPKLEAHLQQFKGRKIKAADLETIAEKFVKPKPIFPEPKATLFTSIVRDFIPPPVSNNIPRLEDGEKDEKIDFSKLNIRGNERINFDTFMESTVNKISDEKNLSLEVQLLVEEYKRKKDNESLKDFEKEIEVKNAKKIVENGEIVKNCGNMKEIDSFKVDDDEKIVRRDENHGDSQLGERIEGIKGVGEVRKPEKKVIHVDVPKLNIEEDSLATGIIEWTKKEVCGTEDYPKFIKIPKNKAQKKITFRVEDRYYDCDGEFLYRVPGLKSV